MPVQLVKSTTINSIEPAAPTAGASNASSIEDSSTALVPADTRAIEASSTALVPARRRGNDFVYVPREQRESALRLARLLPPTRLQQDIARGQKQLGTPLMISFPVCGIVEISTGLKIEHKVKMRISMECAAINDPNTPCFLVYEGHTNNGAVVGIGGGLPHSMFSGSAFGGHTRGQTIAFKRRIDDVDTRKALYEACMKGQTPKDAEWLAPHFEIPAPRQIKDFQVGEMWEQTAEARFSGSGQFGCLFQGIEGGTDFTCRVVLRSEKVSEDTALCTVVPLQFSRYFANMGNVLEKATIHRETAEGSSVTIRFKISTDGGAKSYEGLLDGNIPEAPMAALEGPEDVAVVSRETVNQATVHQHVKLLGDFLSLASVVRQATLRIENSDASRTYDVTARGTISSLGGNKVQNHWEVMGMTKELMLNGRRTKRCEGITVYKLVGLKAASSASRDAANSKYQSARNQQLEELSKDLRYPMPSFKGLQVRGDLAVEALIFLTPDHIDALAKMTEDHVLCATAALGLSSSATKEALDCFSEFRKVDAGTGMEKIYGLALIDPNAHALNEMAIDNDATAARAQTLQRLLRKPHTLQIVTSYLEQIGKLPKPFLRMECPTYRAAYEALADLEAIRNSLVNDDKPADLQATYTRLAEARKLVHHALEIASGDALTAMYMPDAWRRVQGEWREGLREVNDLQTMGTLAERADRGAKVMEPVKRASIRRIKALGSGVRHFDVSRIKTAVAKTPLFDAAPLAQRVGLLCQAIAEGGDDVSAQVKKLSQCVRDVSGEIKKLEAQHAKNLGLRYIVRWERQNLLDILITLQEQPFLAEHPALEEQMQELKRGGMFLPKRSLAPRAGDWTNFDSDEEPDAVRLPPLPTGPVWGPVTRRALLQ